MTNFKKFIEVKPMTLQKYLIILAILQEKFKEVEILYNFVLLGTGITLIIFQFFDSILSFPKVNNKKGTTNV